MSEDYLEAGKQKMTLHRLNIRLRYLIHRSRLVQIGALVGFWLAGEAIVRITKLPVPGGIIGMVMVLMLLATHRISLFSIRRGAGWFLAEMLLFFVPAVLAVLDHQEFLGPLGFKLLAVIVGSTLAVMIVTALTVDLCWRWRARHDAGDPVLE